MPHTHGEQARIGHFVEAQILEAIEVSLFFLMIEAMHSTVRPLDDPWMESHLKPHREPIIAFHLPTHH